ncbi:MAG: ABC transporter ATP-binding protein, partial [Verrucomicrobia bacterium]|nr:ABC transporter ATP-binding protein [Verrucomicrobiota bacterium]
MKNLGRALGFFRADGPLIAGALGLLLLSTAANLLKPWPLALIVDGVLGDKPLPGWLAGPAADRSKPLLLGVLAGAVLVVHLGQGALSAGQNFLTIKIGLRGLARVREQLFHWLQRLSLRFYQGTNTGDVIYRASWDTYAFQTLFQHGLFTGLGATLALGCMVLVMARLNGPLTFVALGTVPLLLLAMKFFGQTMKARSLAAHQTDSQVTSLIQQGIVALPLTQSYTREEHEERRFAGHVASAYEKRLSQHGSEVLYLAAMAIIFGMGTAGIVGLGARQVLAGQLTVGQLLIFLAYLGQLYEPLNQLAHIGATVSDASAGTQRVFELFDAAEEVKEAADARPVRGPKSQVSRPKSEVRGPRSQVQSPKSQVQSAEGGTSNIERRTSNAEISRAGGGGR